MVRETRAPCGDDSPFSPFSPFCFPREGRASHRARACTRAHAPPSIVPSGPARTPRPRPPRSSVEHVTDALVYFVVFLFSTTLHEAAHAWAALRGGDPTAYRGGQVSLDPGASYR
jgi:hypothetical protein